MGNSLRRAHLDSLAWNTAREAVEGAVLGYDALIEILEQLQQGATPAAVESYLKTAREARAELGDLQAQIRSKDRK